MRLEYVYMCLDCAEVFDIKYAKNGKCPRCGKGPIKSVQKWLKPIVDNFSPRTHTDNHRPENGPVTYEPVGE